MKKIRLTVRHDPADPADDLRVAAKVRRDLWAHSPVEVNPDDPRNATRRDADRHAYFECATDFLDEVRRVIDQHGHAARVTVAVLKEDEGPECCSCGQSSGPTLPSVCPRCGFRDISACPGCRQEIPRQDYLPVEGDHFRCPDCKQLVRLSLRQPPFDAEGRPSPLSSSSRRRRKRPMRFDSEGHVVVSPRELQGSAARDRARLINAVLLPGTPHAIPTHAAYCDLLHHISERMGIHPNNLFFKGSTKIGFSIAPRPEKVWMRFGPASDLDLAIVDPGFYQVVDYEVGRWEWNRENRSRMFQTRRLLDEYRARVRHKGEFDCFRFFDLPRIPSMQRLDECLESAPVAACCGAPRTLTAFVFRDWWGVCKRYDFDLHCLGRGLAHPSAPLPPGEDEPRPYAETSDP